MSSCIICNSAHDTQWEPKANAIVCAGCYNDFAIEKRWEVELVWESECPCFMGGSCPTNYAHLEDQA